MDSNDVSSKIRQKVWDGSVPLEIRLHKGDCRTYDESEVYLIQFPRLSYLALLLPKLHAFFSASLIYPDTTNFEDAWLDYDGVPLKWHYPAGLLYDLYAGAEPFGLHAEQEDKSSDKEGSVSGEGKTLPWKLTVHFSDYPVGQLVKLDAAGKVLHDLWINCVKEADFLRTGTGKTIMTLPKAQSEQLWASVQTHNASLYAPINEKLLNPQGMNLRHIPIKLYLPHVASGGTEEEPVPGSIKVLQSPIPMKLGNGSPQTLGTALNSMAPSLFPSRRVPVLALPVLHGAVVGLGLGVEGLLRCGAYADGWLHVNVIMMS